MENSKKTLDKIVALCKNRGYIYAGSEIYGGLANSWDYGPLGAEFKNNVKKAWLKKFVQESPYNVGLDAAIIMNPQTWVTTGHVSSFSDPLLDCKSCKARHRADKLIGDLHPEVNVDAMSFDEMDAYIAGHEDVVCPVCGKHNFTPIRKFNLMFKTAIGVTEDGYREILGAAEGLKEDLESWKNFFVWLKSRGLDGVKLVIGDKALGMVESIGQVFPEAKYQRCTVHFYRNVLSSVPHQKIGSVAKMLKAIHAQEDKEAAREKAAQVVQKLQAMKLGKAAKVVETGFEETLTFMSFPSQHWFRIRTNNTLERLNREIKRRTKVVGTFPDGESALMLVCARLRYVAGSAWGSKRYLNMEHLTSMILSEEEESIAG